MNRRVLFGVASAGALVMLYGGLFGPWWLTFPGAVVIGAVALRARTAIISGALLGLLGWATPLETLQSHYGLAPTANALAAIMGAKGAALIPIALTVVLGVLLGVTGSWLGVAIRGVALSRPRSRAVEKLGDQRLEVKDPVLTQS